VRPDDDATPGTDAGTKEGKIVSARSTGTRMDELYRHEPRGDGTATVELDSDTRADAPVEPNLYAKFTEHLAWNAARR
jgi:hypothetical protein